MAGGRSYLKFDAWSPGCWTGNLMADLFDVQYVIVTCCSMLFDIFSGVFFFLWPLNKDYKHFTEQVRRSVRRGTWYLSWGALTNVPPESCRVHLQNIQRPGRNVALGKRWNDWPGLVSQGIQPLTLENVCACSDPLFLFLFWGWLFHLSYNKIPPPKFTRVLDSIGNCESWGSLDQVLQPYHTDVFLNVF